MDVKKPIVKLSCKKIYLPDDCVSMKLRVSGGSRGAATSKMERFAIIVNGFQLRLGCCSSPRSASESSK